MAEPGHQSVQPVAASGPGTPGDPDQRDRDQVTEQAPPQVAGTPREPEVAPRVAATESSADVAAGQPETAEDDGPEDDEVQHQRDAELTHRPRRCPRRHGSRGD